MLIKAFYTPREVYFNKETILWLLQYRDSLRGGYWPVDPAGNIDNRPMGKVPVGQKAPFVTPIECVAELSIRLEKCGLDGLILLMIECWNESDETISKYLSIPVWSVTKRANCALKYISSGPNRRWQDTKKWEGLSYKDFKKARGKGKVKIGLSGED